MSEGAALVRAVRAAVDDAETELAAMPFLIRPMVKRGFASRTGKSYDQWRQVLDRLAVAATPVEAARAVPGIGEALASLAENFRGAPERARRGMGNDPVAIGRVEEKARVRTAAVEALRAWIADSAN
ncbi:MAG: hypothetical protein K8W52_40095 [Deltaproteobacteria bacterium]|nr:hypothetical protein [Deltaproteobacteria bacterium]